MAHKPDLEISTFQNRPAYRYIRASDNVPKHAGYNPQALVKLFNPAGAGTWYIAEYDPTTRRAFGAAHIHEFEFGYFDMKELVDFRGQFGLPIERDLHWSPRKLSECKGT